MKQISTGNSGAGKSERSYIGTDAERLAFSTVALGAGSTWTVVDETTHVVTAIHVFSGLSWCKY